MVEYQALRLSARTRLFSPHSPGGGLDLNWKRAWLRKRVLAPGASGRPVPCASRAPDYGAGQAAKGRIPLMAY